MFEAVLNQLKEKATNALVEQHGMPKPDAERAAEAAGRSLVDILKERIRNNDFSAVNEALSGTPTEPSHPAIQNLTAPLAAGITGRAGFDATKATGVATALLPLAFNMFNDQVQQAKSKGIDVQALVKQLASGGLSLANMGAAMSLAKNFMQGTGGKSGGGLFSKFF